MVFVNPFVFTEIFFVAVSGGALAQFARKRGSPGWPWVVVLVPGYLFARAFGLLPGALFIAVMFGAVFLLVGGGQRLSDSWQCPDCEFYNDPTTLICPCGHRVEG